MDHSQSGTSFVDHLCYLCLVFLKLLRPFIAALWSLAGKGLTYWLSFVMFNYVLSLSCVVSWFRCGTLLYRFRISAAFLIFLNDHIFYISLQYLAIADNSVHL